MANVTAVSTPAAAPVTSTLYFRRMHPGGGPLGRCSYGVPGVPGIVVFDNGLFLPGAPPATIVLQGVALATPAPRASVAAVTSAVVAGANTAAAVVAGAPIATPQGVAGVAAAAGAAVVAAAATPASSAAVVAGKAAAAAVVAGAGKRHTAA